MDCQLSVVVVVFGAQTQIRVRIWVWIGGEIRRISVARMVFKPICARFYFETTRQFKSATTTRVVSWSSGSVNGVCPFECDFSTPTCLSWVHFIAGRLYTWSKLSDDNQPLFLTLTFRASRALYAKLHDDQFIRLQKYTNDFGNGATINRVVSVIPNLSPFHYVYSLSAGNEFIMAQLNLSLANLLCWRSSHLLILSPQVQPTVLDCDQLQLHWFEERERARDSFDTYFSYNSMRTKWSHKSPF